MMLRVSRALALTVLVFSVAACPPKSPPGAPTDSGLPDDAGTPDSGTPSDAGITDAGITDAGTSGLPNSANSIAFQVGAGRADPEGIAPTSPSTTRITWKDSRGADRTATLYGYLYQYDFTFVGGLADTAQVITRSANDDAWGHPGFGYVVSHNTQTGNSPIGKANAPTAVSTRVFSGAHHALHHIELTYDRDKEGGGNGIKIPVVIEWFVATGRDHPVWAVTWKMGAATNPLNTDLNAYRMDSRGPYGSLNWDGAATKEAGDAVGGVAWGDFGYAFETTDAQLTLNSPWVYNLPNSVNFTRAWTANTNAEMGIVQTKPGDKQLGYPDRVYGRERGATSATAYTDKGNCMGLGDSRVYSVPCISGWPYQLMNYDWDPSGTKPAGEATGTKLMAWGSPYGYLGASDADLFDFSSAYDARGDRAYSTFIVMGPKCRYDGVGACSLPGDVMNALSDVDALSSAVVDHVTMGSVVTVVPKGPGATETKTIVSGYDDAYAVFTLSAASGVAAWTFTPGPGKPVKNPIFRIQGYTATNVPVVTVNGTPVTVNTGGADSGALVSLDTVSHELWVTINLTVTAATTVRVGPS